MDLRDLRGPAVIAGTILGAGLERAGVPLSACLAAVVAVQMAIALAGLAWRRTS